MPFRFVMRFILRAVVIFLAALQPSRASAPEVPLNPALNEVCAAIKKMRQQLPCLGFRMNVETTFKGCWPDPTIEQTFKQVGLFEGEPKLNGSFYFEDDPYCSAWTNAPSLLYGESHSVSYDGRRTIILIKKMGGYPGLQSTSRAEIYRGLYEMSSSELYQAFGTNIVPGMATFAGIGGPEADMATWNKLPSNFITSRKVDARKLVIATYLKAEDLKKREPTEVMELILKPKFGIRQYAQMLYRADGTTLSRTEIVASDFDETLSGPFQFPKKATVKLTSYDPSLQRDGFRQFVINYDYEHLPETYRPNYAQAIPFETNVEDNEQGIAYYTNAKGETQVQKRFPPK